MNTYVFQPDSTDAVTITIQAPNEETAWEAFNLKFEILESMNVQLPAASTWSIVTAF